MAKTRWTQHVHDTSIKRSLDGYNQAVSDWSPMQWFLAMGGEIGEFSNVIKKINREINGYSGNNPEDDMASYLAMVKNEMADIYLYMVLCNAALAEKEDYFTNLNTLVLPSYVQGKSNKVPFRDMTYLEITTAELMVLSGKSLEILLKGTYVLRKHELRKYMTLLVSRLSHLAQHIGFNLETAVKDKFNATSAKINCEVFL